MQDLKAFRRYYNNSLHGELQGYESRRLRLLVVLGIIAGALLGFSIFIISLRIAALSIFLAIPWVVYFQLGRQRVRAFKDQFKPLVVRSILKFIDPRLCYYHKEFIPKDTFYRSSIFPYTLSSYGGEDYIMGNIGEVFFEMCELKATYYSDIKGREELFFDGVFFHANFNTKFEGRIVLFPREDWQMFIGTMKDFTKYGGHELLKTGNEAFDKEFIIYIDPDIHWKEILTPELIEVLDIYHQKSNKKMYVSFIDSHFYMAIAEPYELLEAHFLLSNINFDLLAAYYDELFVFTKIVEDFDVTH
ncbi:MAG: DUF3137 domain-containing protein [Saprospiraceae bacterium]|nr:DUF3137 domain-containing protein [Saprospiraceae bacterium]